MMMIYITSNNKSKEEREGKGIVGKGFCPSAGNDWRGKHNG